MKIIATLLLTIAIAALVAVGVAYSGWYDVSATSAHSGVVRWLLSTTSRASIERRAAGVEVPDLSSETLILAGAVDFDAMCAGCHGAPGRERDPVGQGLNPPPPDLARAAEHESAAELFWTIRNGIKMTGMPAWGVTHEDDELWGIVAFVRELPRLDEPAYRNLLARGEGTGRHGSHHGIHSHHEPSHGTVDADEHTH